MSSRAMGWLDDHFWDFEADGRLDPDEIDEREVKVRIGAIARRRAAGKAAQTRKSR